jgi:hypothetical protein
MRTCLKTKQNPLQNRTGGVAQSVGPEFKPQYCKKKRKKVSDGGIDYNIFPTRPQSWTFVEHFWDKCSSNTSWRILGDIAGETEQF